MHTWLALLTVLFLAFGCDRGNGGGDQNDDSNPIIGRWSMEGNPVVLIIASDGTFSMDGADPRSHRCSEAGFEEAVEACSTGGWESSEEGYVLELPGIDIAVSSEPGQEDQVTECRCNSDRFPAELSGDTLSVDMSSVGGPVFELNRN